jgi:polyisoprenoid-binding protein YceI
VATTAPVIGTDKADPNLKVNKTIYQIDVSHSGVGFATKHLGFSTVKGHFKLMDHSVRPAEPRGEGFITVDENDVLQSSVEFKIETKSIDTGDPERDADLRSARFLDSENFPELTFKSTSIEMIDEENWKVNGELTIKGVTKPIVLDTIFDGRGPGQNGAERSGFQATTTLNRSEFGVGGDADYGDTLKIEIELECPKYTRITQTAEVADAIQAVRDSEAELDVAQIAQDKEALTKICADDLVYFGGTGASQNREEWIATLSSRNTENAQRNTRLTQERADAQGYNTFMLLTGLRVGYEDEFEVEYHGNFCYAFKRYQIQDSMPGEALLPGDWRCLRAVRGWRYDPDMGRWRLISHRYIHAVD